MRNVVPRELGAKVGLYETYRAFHRGNCSHCGAQDTLSYVGRKKSYRFVDKLAKAFCQVSANRWRRVLDPPRADLDVI